MLFSGTFILSTYEIYIPEGVFNEAFSFKIVIEKENTVEIVGHLLHPSLRSHRIVLLFYHLVVSLIKNCGTRKPHVIFRLPFKSRTRRGLSGVRLSLRTQSNLINLFPTLIPSRGFSTNYQNVRQRRGSIPPAGRRRAAHHRYLNSVNFIPRFRDAKSLLELAKVVFQELTTNRKILAGVSRPLEPPPKGR